MATLYHHRLLLSWLIAIVHPGSGKHRGLAVEDPHGVVVGIELIEAWLQQLRAAVLLVDQDVVLLVDLIDLNLRASALQLHLCVGQTRRDHHHRAPAVETEEDSRRQQNLRLPLARLENCPGCTIGGSNEHCWKVLGHSA